MPVRRLAGCYPATARTVGPIAASSLLAQPGVVSTLKAILAYRRESARSRLNLFPLLASFALACSPSPGATCSIDAPNECVDASLSYDGGIGALLTERCSPCHAAGGEEATLLLTDYDHVSRQLMGIGSQLVTCSMPLAGSPQLSADERNQILGWLSCGAPR
ncbi:MAG: hypothetical protein ABI548_13025 [Polyangiaceae bacterium]